MPFDRREVAAVLAFLLSLRAILAMFKVGIESWFLSLFGCILEG
jgi:hypothetical protein